jgi:L-asparaginase II
MTQFALDVVVTRGGAQESRHAVHAVVVDASDTVIGSAGDASLVTFWRSCAKPFQVLPFLESGGFDELSWSADHLALACASHGGEPEHVALAAEMLRDIGLEEGDLACGPHDPLSARGAKVVRDSGDRPTRLHNNCSGKHAAMLARAKTAGWPTRDYERPGHPVQQSVLDAVSRWTGVPEATIGQAVDGCGVVVFSLSLEGMARSYARLGCAAARGDAAPARIVTAMRTRPFLVGGSDRFDSILIEETGGAVIAKVGAEGVHSVAVPDAGLGIAVKAADGAQRAEQVAVLRLLQLLGVLPDPVPPRLAEFAHPTIRNTRREIVGDIRPVA